MTDAEFLLLIVAGVYLSECARWARPEMIVFRTPLGSRWRAGRPGQFIGNQSGGIAFCNPLPPLGQVLICRSWPVAISPEGVVGSVEGTDHEGESAAESRRVIPWSDFRSARNDGRSLFANGRLLAAAGSRQLASGLAKLLTRIPKASPTRRKKIIEKSIRQAFNVEAATTHWKEFRRNAWGLRAMCSMLVLFVFICGPMLIWVPNFWQRWFYLLSMLLLMLFSIDLEYYILHRHYFREARGERWKHLGMMFVSPMAAMRAHDALSYDVMAEFDPLVVGRVVLSPERFKEFAAPIVRRLHHPVAVKVELTGQAKAIDDWYRHQVDRHILEVVQQAALEVADLLAPPEREGDDCLTYCPRCHGQYALASGECPACPGVTLVAFQATAYM